MDVTVWQPDGNDSVRKAPSNSVPLRVISGCNLSIPTISNSESEGETTRLNAFINGSLRLYDYYAGFLDNAPTGNRERNTDAFTSGDSWTRTDYGNATDDLGSDEVMVSIPEPEIESAVERNIQTRRPVRSTVFHDERPFKRARVELGWTEIIGLTLTEFELRSANSASYTMDVSVTCKRRDKRLAMLSIVPAFLGGPSQIVFLFGYNNWRRGRSMSIETVRLTYRSNEIVNSITSTEADDDVGCSCPEYWMCGKCEHSDALTTDNNIRARLRSILSRRQVHVSEWSRSWEVHGVSRLESDSVYVYQVYKRNLLSSSLRSSATVLLDMKRTRLKQKTTQRVRCMVCMGVAPNRSLCIHEKETVKYAEQNTMWEEVGQIIDDVSSSSSDDAAVRSRDTSQISARECDKQTVSYLSTQPRHFFACSADEKALCEVLEAIQRAKGEEDSLFCAVDQTVVCKSCAVGMYSSVIVTRRKRLVSLHTLHHGSATIWVMDSICPLCNSPLPYDGLSDGLFVLNKNHVFTRELLDSWMWDCCGTGGTFRDCFSSWFGKMCSTSARMNQLGDGVTLNRQRANEAFTEFLMTLSFPSEQVLGSMFSCSTCEHKTHSGYRRLDGVVMDGTALGILGKLPEFQRLTSLVKATRGVPERQYIMRDAKSRRFVDVICSTARKSGDRKTFEVHLEAKLWKKKEELIQTFFHHSENIDDEAYFVAKFFKAAFTLGNTEDDGISSSDGQDSESENETVKRGGKILVSHTIDDCELRRTLGEFGRCFCSGSIAGQSLRRTSSIALAISMRESLRKFALCTHNDVGFGAVSSAICSQCCRDLENIATSARDELSSVSQLCQSLVDAGMSHENVSFRKVAASVADLIDKAIDTRTEYFNRFEESQDEDVIEYNEQHRDGLNVNESGHMNWISETQRTGQVFPGRPVVRPSISFGQSARLENSKSCSKKYPKSLSHSPGIFTVQCVCKYPKLLGLSVMTECEGVSTALSVLLSRFRVLPRVTYYDNACNMLRSVILRFPWINDDTRIVCDRFHYTGHTCNSVCDPDSYITCAMHNTSSAESVNHLWTFSKSHLRFLKPSNMMPFLATRAVFLNIRASVREKLRKQDITMREIYKFVRETINCTCSRCSSIGENNTDH